MIVALFIASGLFDLWSTITCCGAYATAEENPILRTLWLLWGPWGLVAGKLLGMALVLWLINLAKSRYGDKWLIGGIPLVVGIVYQLAAGLTNMAWIPYGATEWMFKLIGY